MLLLAIASAARAQGTAQLDLSRSVPMTSAESQAMGAAGLGFATGAKGIFFHPAAPAMRPVESRSRWTGTVAVNLSTFAEVAAAADLGAPADTWGGGTLNTGATVSWGRAGVGLVYSTLVQGSGDRVVRTTEGHAVGAWSWGEGRVVLGAGYRLASASVWAGESAAEYAGSGFETGVQWVAVGGWNLAGVWRSRIDAARLPTGDLAAPDRAVLPWQVLIGGSWVGTAPVLGRPARFAADLAVDGPVEQGLSVTAMAYGVAQPKGAKVRVSPRVGVEIEAVPGWLRVRAGSWIEPSRGPSGGATPRNGRAGGALVLHPVVRGPAAPPVCRLGRRCRR